MTEYFLRNYAPEFGKDVRKLAPETLQLMEAYHWPGNVRELESVVKQSLLIARGNVLLPEFLPELSVKDSANFDDQQNGQYPTQTFVADRLKSGQGELYASTISAVEQPLFRQVLQHTQGNQLKAATILGISRVTLRGKLKSLGIDPDDFR